MKNDRQIVKTIFKFIIIFGIILGLFICILASDVSAQVKPIEGMEGYFTTTEVNMRKGPGLKYEIYKTLPKGYLLDIINDQDPSGWLEVWEDDNVYFVYKEYVESRLPFNEELEK